MNRIITNWPKIPGTVAVHDIMTFDYQSNDILWVCDTLKSECLDSLKKQGNLPMFIVGDNASAINHRDFSVYTTPFRGLELEFIKFQHLNFEDTVNDTRHCFNFLINKKQTNRYLLIKLVEYFNLDNFEYTWSGVGQNFDMSLIINEWNQVDPDCVIFPQHFRSSMLEPIALPKKFVELGTQSETNSASIRNYGGNLKTWCDIFSKFMPLSGIALISESVDFTKSSVFTEKTLYALMALNFPIFVGGYGHADQLTKMGFDAFDDIIDHRYQYKETLIERCYYAFYDNLDLLRNLDLVKSLRQQHYTRLKNNRDKLYQGQLSLAVNKDILSWPKELQSIITPIWTNYKISL